MKKLLLALASVASLAAGIAGSAQAQPFERYPMRMDINQRLGSDIRHIAWCERTGRMSEGEAIALEHQFQDITRLYMILRQGGLSPREAAIINYRLSILEREIAADCNHLRIRELGPYVDGPVHVGPGDPVEFGPRYGGERGGRFDGERGPIGVRR